jgi:hypothetical protein
MKSYYKGGFKKIADLPGDCRHPEHEPPKHVVLDNGVYEYTCPGCGARRYITIAGPTW